MEALTMKALCVRQPYAEVIARGIKTIEVRTWETKHRGPILIVASSNAYPEDMPLFDLTDRDCPRSTAVCVVDLVDIGHPRRPTPEQARAACCDLQRGDLLWHIVRPRRVRPFAVKGKLRLFDLPDDLISVDLSTLHIGG
jgi:hypothetical protein